MKISKLLLLTPCIALTAIPTISCDKQEGFTAKRVAKAIFDPVDIETSVIPPQPVDGIITAMHYLMNEKERQNEILYDLFIFADIDGCKVDNNYLINQTDTLRTLYKNKTIGIKTNITKCKMRFVPGTDIDSVFVDFLGYVSFIFIKDYETDFGTYKANDYLMFTYDLESFEVFQAEPAKWALKYDPALNKKAVGFVKQRINGGGGLYSIPFINMQILTGEQDIATNSKYWER